MLLGKLVFSMQKTETRSMSFILFNSKWIKDVNIRPETLLLVQEGAGNTINFFLCVCDCGLYISIFIPIIFFLSLSILSILPSSSSHPYSHLLHSPVLKSITPLHNNSFCPFSPTLFPQPSPSLPILSQPVTRLPLPPTHSSLAYQTTIPTLQNPKPLKSLTQAPSTTTTEIYPNTHKGHKN
jgi:hypothetical protein